MALPKSDNNNSNNIYSNTFNINLAMLPQD